MTAGGGRARRPGLTIRDMALSTGRARPAGFPAGRARWVSLAVFAAVVGVAVTPLHPSPAVAGVAAAATVAAGALLVRVPAR